MAETEWSTITPNQGESQEKIEIEIEGQEEEAQEAAPSKPEVEIEEDTTATEEVVAKQEETREDEDKAVEGVETSGAQKRIRQLVKQKKEREAQIEELLEAQKEMQRKLQQREEEYGTLLNSNVESNERQISERIELAKNAYREALDSGESDRILQAQESLTNAQQDSYNIKNFKQQAEAFKPTSFEEQQQQQAPVNVVAQRKAQQWAVENEWFNNDRVLTAAALEIDNDVQAEGFDPADDEYYEEVNRRMAETFPNKFGKATEEVVAEKPRTKPTSTASQVVAGASHTSASPSNKKVKLSQEDVRLAQKWGITLEQYAAEKLKVESAGEGEYTTINR
jgi:hypothetical protein